MFSKILSIFNTRKFKIAVFGFFVIGLMLATFVFLQLISAPALENEKIVVIPEGYSITKAGELLEDEGIIHSSLLFKALSQYKKISLKAGPYYFSESENLFMVISRLANSDYGDVYISITIPEGSTNDQLINIIKKNQSHLDEQKLTNLVSGKEGYLFPDTYSFLPEKGEETIIERLEGTFLERIEKVEETQHIQKTRSDIVIMGSLLEKEAANNLEQKQIVSGILWKRIREGIPLQVDAPFLYERGKGSAQLSNQDLRENSPYNTYVNKGLTPTPIGNPGYDSLYAAAHPIESEYYFYLHGNDGEIHYAKDHNGHLKNKRMYLR